MYIDDVLVVGRTFEEHLENLRKVLERLRVAGLRLKPVKCIFAGSKVVYLGFVVSRESTKGGSCEELSSATRCEGTSFISGTCFVLSKVHFWVFSGG